MTKPHFKRILLKVSGEVLMGEQAYGIDLQTVQRVAAEIEAVAKLGTQLCIVIGAGNIFDASGGAAGQYNGLWKMASTTTIGLTTTGSSQFVGAGPSFALANTDSMEGFVVYEAAS
jgi:uridylate kinase